ncbi:two-component system sensor histidine kinase ChvG [Roseibium hamelinense]|uniref:histidine kinase n=1 Tax=Roseibium hamelinense TaxID=150831 RepID=A0A562T201_9HYPH|nr:sensor histidine kinase [Roseibium hamelinense]MTI44572.1 HAMP domain-containing protein [Roseibium hamelinense]TWI87198.1 two-component system sensor histidine kinase ChvG [Roseibium hamelinense]
MTAETDKSDSFELREGRSSGDRSQLRRLGNRRVRRRFLGQLGQIFGTYVLSSLTRRILAINLVGLIALVIGILYLNQFRAGLIDARVQSLLTQGEIIAGAIAASATVDTGAITVDPERLLQLQAGESITPGGDDLDSLDFPVNPERVGPVLRRLISPTKTRARIYDPEGILILDSRHLYSGAQILRFDLPPQTADEPGVFDTIWQTMKLWFRRGDMPIYQEAGGGDGRVYPEVEAALAGSPATFTRVSPRGELIVSVAVPIQRFRAVLGGLLLSTQGGDIDAIVRAERIAIMRVFLVAATVTILLSILLAGTIAGPVRRLAAAAERVRKGSDSREEIPEFSDRQDEIGHLARAFRDMTNALYNKIDAIEQFAADVAHELKNPLTSLRSAVETLPLAKTDESRERLLDVIQHDVRRLDRLITDISDASRLDAELARAQAEPIDLSVLLRAIVDAGNQRGGGEEGGEVFLTVANASGAKPYVVFGHDIRLGQVVSNLIDNARSFSPADGSVRIGLSRNGKDVQITVDDDGPGIRAENTDRIFERFYTDRPEGEGFGNNSGLGLSISRQIIEAHRGEISVTNRIEETEDESEQRIAGARFTIVLPAHVQK